MKSKKVTIIVIVIVLVIAGYFALSKKKPPPPVKHSVPVLAGKAVQKTMPLIIEAIGSVEANNSVTIYSRVVGLLQKIHFKEGQDVQKGDLIFTLDPAPFKEKLRNAEAKLAQDTAQLKYNESEAKRYAFLMEKGAVSKSDFENKQTLAATQEAIVNGDKADADNARLNVDFCYIRAPLTGRTGAYIVHEGTMIKDNDTKLAVINQIIPIYVKFSVAEKQLPDIRKYMASNKLKVRAFTPGFQDKTLEGTLSFIDNTVDPATGMIMLKATFANKDKFLWPGQFVNIVLQLTEEPNSIVVPAAAVQISQSGSYIFVVKPDKKVEYRLVTVSRTIGNETVITKGILADETVVTDGQLKLREGFPVEIRDFLTPAVSGATAKPVDTPNKK
ncbi:MAG: efflux RND transporter periplasmic adaptor subunit [Proteobacteria bacterium]|nr:efflux RND transporter periplasmic adaptor subunit [Pseudomonadota bacterium]